MEITINTSNKEDVRKAIEILKGFLDETAPEKTLNEPFVPSLDTLNMNTSENIKINEAPSLNSMIDESKEEENEKNFENGIIPY